MPPNLALQRTADRKTERLVFRLTTCGGSPFCSSGLTARTVTEPPVTFCDMRARKAPDTLRANHSVVAFAGTAMVVKAVHPDDNIGVLPP